MEIAVCTEQNDKMRSRIKFGPVPLFTLLKHILYYGKNFQLLKIRYREFSLYMVVL